MHMNSPIPIQTSSLILRHFVLEDTSRVFALSLESGIQTWIPDQVYKNEQTASEVLQYLIDQYQNDAVPAHAPYVLGICLKSSLELIGHVGLSPALENEVEVGYAIEEKYQGRGYASQAVTAMSEWGIQYFGLSQILGIVASENIASCKVLANSGYELTNEVKGKLHNWKRIVKTYKRYSSGMIVQHLFD